VAAHTFNPSTWEAEAGGFLEFEASLVYRVSSRTAKAIQRNPVSNIPPPPPAKQTTPVMLCECFCFNPRRGCGTASDYPQQQTICLLSALERV
jgi:hypothetical protein